MSQGEVAIFWVVCPITKHWESAMMYTKRLNPFGADSRGSKEALLDEDQGRTNPFAAEKRQDDDAAFCQNSLTVVIYLSFGSGSGTAL